MHGPRRTGVEVTVLPCKHWSHPTCISVWLNGHDTCMSSRGFRNRATLSTSTTYSGRSTLASGIGPCPIFPLQLQKVADVYRSSPGKREHIDVAGGNETADICRIPVLFPIQLRIETVSFISSLLQRALDRDSKSTHAAVSLILYPRPSFIKRLVGTRLGCKNSLHRLFKIILSNCCLPQSKDQTVIYI